MRRNRGHHELSQERKDIDERVRLYEQHLLDKKARKKQEQQEMAQFLKKQHEVKLATKTLSDKLLDKREFALNKQLLQQVGVIND